jgi:hypothetical protein
MAAPATIRAARTTPAAAETAITYAKYDAGLELIRSLITGADVANDTARTIRKELAEEVRKMLLRGYSNLRLNR